MAMAAALGFILPSRFSVNSSAIPNTHQKNIILLKRSTRIQRKKRFNSASFVVRSCAAASGTAWITQQDCLETVWQALAASPEVATHNQHHIVGTEHLMQALLEPKNGIARRIFFMLGVDNTQLLASTHKFIQIQRQPKFLGETSGPMLGKDLQTLVRHATDFKKLYGDSFVSVEHLLLAFAKDKRFGKRLFKEFHISLQALKSVVEAIGGRQTLMDQGMHESLEKYGKDLTALAKCGKLDPVIRMDDEIHRCIHILSKRTNNNPVLTCEPGVHRAAIYEGLAQRIVQGDVPRALMNRKLIYLDLDAITAGETSCHEQFSDPWEAVLEEVTASDCQIILFINEIHTVIGEGAYNPYTANLLKQMLGRSEPSCIGATTLDGYQQIIENHPDLEQCFQKVYVGQPTVEEVISILRGEREKIELHHGARISDSALAEAVILSDKYVSGRCLPDKAADLVDEAASKLIMEITSKPTERDEINRSVLKVEMECLRLTNDADKASKDRLNCLKAELALLKEKQRLLHEQWAHEKSVLAYIQSLKGAIDRLNLEIQQAEREHDLDRAAELRNGSLSSLKCELEDAEKELDEYMKSGRSMAREEEEEVTANDIAEIVSKRTGIPVSNLQQPEREKILHLEEELGKRVVGQNLAVTAVAKAIQRSRARLSDPQRPIASFMFMGPTGVGKTELPKSLASYMFNTEDALVRIDMSEYMEKHTVSRLIGSPPGYVGHKDGGQLTEAVRRRPNAVILFDEIEKAHSDVFNIFLQILDDGRLTDSKGSTVRFTNTVLIMTSNVGSQYIPLLNDDASESAYETIKKKVMDAARSIFRPEFLNRVDEYIVFKPLDRDQINNIVKLQLQRVQKRLADRKMKLRATDGAVQFLADLGYDPNYGARPVKRVIQQKVENELAESILRGKFKEHDTILIDTTDSDITGLQPLLQQKLVFKRDESRH